MAEHVEVLREMFAECANDRRMKEAYALESAIRALSTVGDDDPNVLVAELRQEIARLRALSPAGGDWVMAPRKVTRAMLEAYWLHGYDGSEEEELKAMLTEGDLAVLQAEWNAMLAASPQQEPGAEGCGACGDSCANRGACRLEDDSPTRLYALAAAIRGEADIADRPGQMARLNAIADELSVHSKPTHAHDPSGQTLAGAGGDALMKCVCGDPKDGGGCTNRCDRGQIQPIPAATYRVTDGKLQKATATSAGTTGDDSEDAARYRWLRNQGPAWDDRPFIAIHSAGGFSQWTGDKADAAIDAARRARGEGS